MVPRTYREPRRQSYDVVIVGGAVMGSSTAFWLSENEAFDGSVLVVERDSSYARSATALSTSSIRQQFSNPINIRISQFGVDFIRGFAERMQPYFAGEPAPDLGFREHGYLYCCSPEGAEAARARVELQREHGAQTVFLDPGALRDRFPWVNTEDLGGASWGSAAEGWFDSVGLMHGFRRAARSNGVEYVENEVVDVLTDGDRVTAVELATGERVACATMVNAAGSRGPAIARKAGLDIPVEPRKRHSFVFASRTPIPGRMPNVIDLSGTFVRPEHDLFLTGNVPVPDEAAEVDDFETRHEEFHERIWPALYHRIPAFEALKVRRFWTGHYDLCTLDQNAIIGFHPKVRNFVFANGFSGHGLQQSPAVGRGISELIVHGGYRTLDLSPLGYERVARGEPFPEKAVI